MDEIAGKASFPFRSTRHDDLDVWSKARDSFPGSAVALFRQGRSHLVTGSGGKVGINNPKYHAEIYEKPERTISILMDVHSPQGSSGGSMMRAHCDRELQQRHTRSLRQWKLRRIHLYYLDTGAGEGVPSQCLRRTKSKPCFIRMYLKPLDIWGIPYHPICPYSSEIGLVQINWLVQRCTKYPGSILTPTWGLRGDKNS